MGKGKLAKFSDMDSFENVFQYTYGVWRESGKPFEKKGQWSSYFGNNHPIVLELGCGKGEYTVAQAEMNADKNYIGVDIKGARMWTGAKQAIEKGLKNVAFIRTSIEMISAFFEKGEISEIWLTFPDPQMKKVNKRLTSSTFLRIYQQIIATNGTVNLKTDSQFMFTYTDELLKANNIQPTDRITDLYASEKANDPVLSIKTYYEQQWLGRGITIKYLAFPLDDRNSFTEPDVEIEYDSYRSFGRDARTIINNGKMNTGKKEMSFSEIQDYVRRELAKYKFKKEPQGLYEPIAYELVEIGGKRLRPAFTLFACQLFCGDVQPALSAALGLEMFHNFTLLHDDIMDHADKRRGKPTVHKVWDENTAILSGDTMMAKAYELIAKTKNKYMPAVLKHFNETVIGVMEGQQYDMNFESTQKVSIADYMEMIRLKTAVLLAGSLKIGAICGGADKKDANALYEFGIGVGLSFQLCDDILDVYGDTKVFGKNIGGDIVENKKTYLYLKALELAKGTPDEAALVDWFTKESFDKVEKIKAVTAIYNRLDVKKATEDEMNRQYEIAVKALEGTSLDEKQKTELVKLANGLLKRES